MSVEFLGTGFPDDHDYGPEERAIWKSVCDQVDKAYPDKKNLVVSLTWFGAQFQDSDWYTLYDYQQKNIKFDHLFLLATVDPPYLNPTEIQEVKNMVGAIKLFLLGNFDSPYQFNFFAASIVDKFKVYTKEEITLKSATNVFVNYNRKPKPHRVDLVNRLRNERLDECGVITLGIDEDHNHDKDNPNDLYLSIGETHEQYIDEGNRPSVWNFGIPQVYYSLSDINIWQNTFLYVNGATEFNPVDDLFCQQDTFKPMIGLRPFVINGSQKTYHWLRYNGFKTFNHYWPHIDIENGNVHDTIIELLHWLKTQDLQKMYLDMLPDLKYNKERFFEFAREQQHKINHLFDNK